MRATNYKGKKASTMQLERICSVRDKDCFNNGEDSYTVILGDDEKSMERCYYYIKVCVDSKTSKINRIERYKDIYLTNYIVNKMPLSMEVKADEILSTVTLE